jgi:hypothetical protein
VVHLNITHDMFYRLQYVDRNGIVNGSSCVYPEMPFYTFLPDHKIVDECEFCYYGKVVRRFKRNTAKEIREFIDSFFLNVVRNKKLEAV